MRATCGNCGEALAAEKIVCPHCSAVMATQSNSWETPDYTLPPDARGSSRPPGHQSLFPNPAITSPVQEAEPAPPVQSTAKQETATQLVNVISSYIQIRELQARNERMQSRRVPKDRQSATTTPAKSPNGGKQTGNIAVAIGVGMGVVLSIMWGIVITMLMTEMVSTVFIAITVVLTLGIIPTITSIRKAF